MMRKITAILFVSGFLVGMLILPAQMANSNEYILELSCNESSSLQAYSVVSPGRKGSCWHDNKEYEEGTEICVDGQLLECVSGRWIDRGSC